VLWGPAAVIPAGPHITPGVRLATKLAILAGAFVAGTLVAELFGAVNLGTALGVGQICFALALVYLLLRG
jgi:uncharacterized membrane protein (DUF485 family)